MKSVDVRADIPLLEDIIYLDAAATTPTPIPVVEAMRDYFYNYNSNTGRGAYRIAVKSTTKIEETRNKISKFIKCHENEVIFTKNTTEAINMVANGFEFKKGDSVVVPNIEHHSNLVPWLNLKKKGVDVRIIKADESGVVDPSDVERAVDKTTKLITLTHISNAIGSLQPIYEIGDIAKEKDVFYLIDAAQSLGHLEIDVNSTNADFMAFPGHKGLLGPVGTGFLYCRSECAEKIKPSNLGGGTVLEVGEDDFTLDTAPARFEGGTQNIAGIIGLGVAVDYIKKIGLEKIERHDRKLTRYMFDQIDTIDNTICYGDPENIYGILSFNISNINPHDVAKILDEVKQICVRSGNHCAIPAIRHINAYKLGGTVRASIHYYNTKEDIQILADIVEKVSKSLGD